MPTGRLGAADLVAAANTSVYIVPATTFSVVTLSICNRGSTAATLRVSVSASSTPANNEFIEFDSSLAPKGVLERTGIVLDAGKFLVVNSNVANVTAVAYGIETSTA
jgi:hypothetical protein